MKWKAALVIASVILFAVAGAQAQSDDAAAVGGSGLSTVPGEMDGMEQLFGGEGDPRNDEVINDTQKKPVAPVV